MKPNLKIQSYSYFLRLTILKRLGILIFLLLTNSLLYAQNEAPRDPSPLFLKRDIERPQTYKERKISPPKKILYNDKNYYYDPDRQNKETCLETNLDGDEDDEIVIGFMANFKQEKEAPAEEPLPFTRQKREIAIIEHQAFYQIYDKGLDGYYEPIKMFTGMDQPGRIELVKLDDNHPRAIAIYSPGGQNFTDLSIYLWKEGGYRLMLNQSGTQKIYVDAISKPVSIKLIKDNQSETSTIFIWDESLEAFKTPALK